MKCIVYIGNKSRNDDKTNLSSIDILTPLLRESGFSVFSVSDKKNIFTRLLHMLHTCFKYRNKVDYVLIDTYSTLNFYYAFFVSQLCGVLKLKYVPILHGGNLPNRLENSPKLSKAIFKKAHVNVAPSKYMMSKFVSFGINNIIFIPNTIELKNYTFKKRNFDKVKLLWVRSFSKIYNPLLAVEILKKLKTENIDTELCMVGPDSDGSLKEAKAYAKQLKVDVKFTGKLSKKKWLNLSKEYNVFINTTNFDNMPVSVIEAMALGLPIVSTNVGGLPFLIENNKNGLLVEPDSAELFVKAIKNLIEFPEKTNQMILESRKKIEQYDWKIVKNQWEELFQ
ncbi:glycosyltransferase family 4 protein [Flaviramulus sp. BrNp1-15]|uniref:glycosyltransferase family 4 protein n=1 Tax=Flaviramulus sp. BrNp1-15 TaxID=2916754 RepID=UPI001EE85437|nr:glycosyltransferase family 4 protein [Flaviramulus sp. BrNp1-15]ULC60587.1 glycosyltransferase family 4 protein [Flaviramulus sp. BrNp1-15]